MDYYAKYKKYKKKYRYINLLFGGWFNFDNTQPKKFTYKRHTQSTVRSTTTGHITPGGYELETILNSLYTYFHNNNQSVILGIITDPRNTFLNRAYAKPAKADINSLHTGSNENDMNGGIQRILSTIGYLPDRNFLYIYGLLKLSYQKYKDYDYDNKTGIDSGNHILIRNILNNKIKSCLDRFYRINEYNVLTSYNFIQNIHKYNKLNNKVSKNQLKNLRRIYKSIIIKQLIAQGTNLRKTIDDLIVSQGLETQSDEIVRNESLCYDFLLDYMPHILDIARNTLISQFYQNKSKSESSFVEDLFGTDALRIDETLESDGDDSVDTEKTAIQSEKENFSADDISLQQLADTISHYQDDDDEHDILHLQEQIRIETEKDENRRAIQKRVTEDKEEQQRKFEEKRNEVVTSYFKQKKDEIADSDDLLKRGEQLNEQAKRDPDVFACHLAREEWLSARKHLDTLESKSMTQTPQIINAQKELAEKEFILDYNNIKLQFVTQTEMREYLLDILEPYKDRHYDSDLGMEAKIRIVDSLIGPNTNAEAGAIIEKYRNKAERAVPYLRNIAASSDKYMSAVRATQPVVANLITKMGTAKLIKQFREWTKTWKDLSNVQNLIQVLDIASRVSKQTMVNSIVDDIDALKEKKTKKQGKKGKKKRK